MRMIYMAIMIPGIVIGIATLIALVTLFGFSESGLGSQLAGLGSAPRRGLNMGYALP